jgi:hypothetical protein
MTTRDRDKDADKDRAHRLYLYSRCQEVILHPFGKNLQNCGTFYLPYLVFLPSGSCSLSCLDSDVSIEVSPCLPLDFPAFSCLGLGLAPWPWPSALAFCLVPWPWPCRLVSRRTLNSLVLFWIVHFSLLPYILEPKKTKQQKRNAKGTFYAADQFGNRVRDLFVSACLVWTCLIVVPLPPVLWLPCLGIASMSLPYDCIMHFDLVLLLSFLVVLLLACLFL